MVLFAWDCLILIVIMIGCQGCYSLMRCWLEILLVSNFNDVLSAMLLVSGGGNPGEAVDDDEGVMSITKGHWALQ